MKSDIVEKWVKQARRMTIEQRILFVKNTREMVRVVVNLRTTARSNLSENMERAARYILENLTEAQRAMWARMCNQTAAAVEREIHAIEEAKQKALSEFDLIKRGVWSPSPPPGEQQQLTFRLCVRPIRPKRDDGFWSKVRRQCLDLQRADVALN